MGETDMACFVPHIGVILVTAPAASSRMAVWNDLESRLDTWASVGALTVGIVAATLAFAILA